MFIVLLCIAFSSTLNFQGLTLISLVTWFNIHPFLALMAISELFTVTNKITNSCKCNEGKDNEK
jgi:hypothetical protein